MADRTARHVPLSVIESYLSKGLDGVIGIEGEPPAQIVIEPANQILAVRFPETDVVPNVTALANLHLARVQDEGKYWHQLSVRLGDNTDEVYALVCAIVDKVQLSASSFASATHEVLDSFSEILATRVRLSPEKQLGLAGELLALLALASDIGPDAAVKAWRGPMSEEHDFGLPEADVEVKTTLSEKRQHWISSFTQLVATGDRSLYLLSVQLTGSGAGAGWTLPSLITRVRQVPAISADILDTSLSAVGYRKQDADLYGSRWALRTKPEFFIVDSSFPAITRPALEKAIPSSNRVLDVRYRVDLTGLSTAAPLFTFDRVTDTKESG